MKEIRSASLKELLERVDWIPGVSTITNLAHIFNRSLDVRAQNTDYASYLRERSFLIHTGLCIPIFNIITQIYQKQFSSKVENIKLVRLHGRFYTSLDEKSRKDFDIAFEAFGSCHPPLSMAPREFQDDERLVKRAIQSDPYSYLDASLRLKHSKQIVLYAISRSTDIFSLIPPSLQLDDEIAMYALERDGNILSFLSYEKRDNPDVVLKAIEKLGKPIVFASERLQNDRKFLLTAIKIQPQVFAFIKERFYLDKSFALEAMELNGLVLEYVPLVWKDDESIVKKAYLENPYSKDFATLRMRKIL